MNIQPDQAALWGKDREELFKTELDNIRNKYPLHEMKTDLANLKVWLFKASLATQTFGYLE